MKNKGQKVVFCLHGLGNSKYLMSLLCLYLRQQGYKVFNFQYPSTTASLQQLTLLVADKIDSELKKHNYSEINFLGFSLGSQILFELINSDKFNYPVSKFVMLGPPSRGSQFARMLKRFLPADKIWGPVYKQLCEVKELSFKGTTEIGIIAGGTGFKYGFSPFLNGDNDGIVTVSETYCNGYKQHKTIFCIHGLMPLSPRIWILTVRFLKNGQF